MEITPKYINKHGCIVSVTITNHCYRRFVSRWKIVLKDKKLPYDINMEVAQWFNRSQRVTNLNGKEKDRVKRYGKDTLFFRADTFTFIVQNSRIITVEISDHYKRSLNR